MNTYQFTAVHCREQDKDHKTILEPIDAENLDEARKIFRVACPEDEWVITGEELIQVDGQDDTAGDKKELLQHIRKYGIPKEVYIDRPQSDTSGGREATVRPAEEGCPGCHLKADPDIKKLAKTLNEPGNIVIAEEYPQGEAARLREKVVKLEEEAGRKLLAATERLQELGRLVSSLKGELEEEKRCRAEAERKLAEARRQLAKVQEEAEAQQVRADSAAEEIVYLKARLYDYMTELE